jgi:hypothetical protein
MQPATSQPKPSGPMDNHVARSGDVDKIGMLKAAVKMVAIDLLPRAVFDPDSAVRELVQCANPHNPDAKPPSRGKVKKELTLLAGQTKDSV